jgi:glucan phosphoethanolaminetransferase (alkaline phosphatase superfamily)
VTLLLNPVTLSLVCDLFLGRFTAFNPGQWLFYILSLVGSGCWWLFLAWLVRDAQPRRNQILTAIIVGIYSLNFILVYGYRLTAGAMPTYYTFEYLFAEPYNNWTILRDSWELSHTLAIPIVAAVYWLGFRHWRSYLAARGQMRRHSVVAAGYLTIAVLVQFVLHNNIRFVDQCFTADMTTSTGVMRNIYTRITDPNAGRSGLSARMPMTLPVFPPATSWWGNNTLIILTESLRADGLGVYGSKRSTSPYLDSLVQDYTGRAIVFDNAFASATMTFVAVPTLVTGASPLSDARTLHTQPTLWEYSKMFGYETFFFTSQSQEWENIRTYFTIPAIDQLWNMESSGIPSENDLGIDDRFVVDHFVSYIENRNKNSRFTGVVQLNQTHYPYWTPDSLRPFGDDTRRDKYDNAIRYTDDQLRRVFEVLSLYGLIDHTFVVILSDHGEAFNEHGVIGHLNCLYREGIRVPMIWFMPHTATGDMTERTRRLTVMRTNSTRNVSNLDVVPTLIDLAGVWNHVELNDARQGIEGRSLLDSLPEDRVIVTSNLTEMTRRHLGLSLVTGHWHFILNLQGEKMGVEELYDWSIDPDETKNVIADISPDIRRRIDDYLGSYPVSQRIKNSLSDR